MLRVLLTRQCQIENIVWKLDSTHRFSVFLNCEWIHLIMVLYESHKIPIHYFLVCVVATNCWRLAVWIDPSWKQLNQTFTPNAISKIYLACNLHQLAQVEFAYSIFDTLLSTCVHIIVPQTHSSLCYGYHKELWISDYGHTELRKFCVNRATILQLE